MSEVKLPLAQPKGADGLQPLWRSKNRLKMGSFHWNVQGGATLSLGEGRINDLNWDQQVRIAQASEAAGLDVIVPVARWKAIGEPSEYWGQTYETMTWAAGLSAVTSRVTIFATVHVPLLHPVRAAKMAVTIDHMSGGRFGLNIVAGWNTAEFAMFGKQQRSHGERYEEAAEWTSFVKKLWSEKDPFDWDGKYYQSTQAHSDPRPLGARPLLMSAGSSPDGQAFAARNVDIIFVGAPNDLDDCRAAFQKIKDQAAANGRDVQIWTSAWLLCRPTEAEARREYDYWVHEKGDWKAAEAYFKQFVGGGGQSMDAIAKQSVLESLVAQGHPLVGTPAQIVERLSRLSDVGLDGVLYIAGDYEEQLDIFGRDVRPLARQAGLMA